MHKKSIEAAHKLKEEDDDCKSTDGQEDKDTQTPPPQLDKEELRSESIAQLRAKAQSYSAKMREAINLNSETNTTTNHDRFSSSFETPKQSDSCDSETLDPTNWNLEWMAARWRCGGNPDVAWTKIAWRRERHADSWRFHCNTPIAIQTLRVLLETRSWCPQKLWCEEHRRQGLIGPNRPLTIL